MKHATLNFTLAILLFISTQVGAGHVVVVPGYVSHGINVFNNNAIVDYSQASPSVPWLNPSTLISEIGVLDESANDAAIIDETTDRSLPVATIRAFFDFFNPGGTLDPNLLNQPLDQIGSSFFTFSDLSQRAALVPFDTANPGDLYRGKHTNARPTVAQWEQISGQLRIRCKADGSAVARVTVRNGFPNAVYTLWDIGALNPLTEQEQGYAAPFGGLPNILLTDNKGCGYKKVDLAFCPPEDCTVGAGFCLSYISAFYHWDAQVYGGSPAATFAGAPVGVVASNQIVWPLSGVALIEPQNKFQPRRQGCPR